MSKKKNKQKAANSNSIYIRSFILLLCALGMGLCVYTLHVEISKENDKSYTAYCDISDLISCSRVFTSRYGRGFGLIDRVLGKDSILNQPNSVFGMAFYTFQTILAFNSGYVGSVVQLVASIISNIGSVYLAYILYFVLQDFCIVCISTYVVNLLLLFVSIVKYRRALLVESKKKR
ncbi:hypothetical protein LOTGIDRAFT_115113 [Lottia gigantea]|uniref:vitamin-K-epoxide reductase (warfarin-sensitive) n=1 Tax=Lottia gigantea TaxID=225164 RepID=V4C6M3_LOTGI|nr:hypothetical protein LOTGIDRAFT_115113 [Lottia gigantea]ESO97314.1 hypothetical protein LOTGIDRAFT_115113 [Lottia gigantea]